MTTHSRTRAGASVTEFSRAGFAALSSAVPLAVSARPSVVILAAAALLLLLVRHGGATLAGGLCIVGEVALAVGRSDSATALIVGGAVGAAVVALSAISCPSSLGVALRIRLWVDLVLGGVLAAAVVTVPGTGSASAFAGLLGAGVLIAAVGIRGIRPNRASGSNGRRTPRG